MRAAKLAKSDRLQRTHEFLLRTYPAWVSTMRIIEGAQVCAVSAIVSELRQNDVPVECKREGDVWWYRLGE